MRSRAGIIATVVIFIMATLSYLEFDKGVERFFWAHRMTTWSHFFHEISFLGKSEYYLIPSLLLYYIYKNRDLQIAMKSIYLFWSVALGGIAVWVVKIVAGRFRPGHLIHDGQYGFDYFHVVHDLTSFPSGHSATVFGVAMALWLIFRKGWVWLFGFAFLIALSRMVIVRHFPSDVMIGALIGVWVSYLIYEYKFKEEW